MAESAGVALGTVALFFQLYDVCTRLHNSCKTILRFGEDAALQWRRLAALKWDLDTLMQCPTGHLRKPPDLSNPNHSVTKEIANHLTIIQTHFRNCRKIVSRVFGQSPESLVMARSHDWQRILDITSLSLANLYL